VDGVVDETDMSKYNFGEGWSSNWLIKTSLGQVYGDDFQSYVDGPVLNLTLSGGTGWESPAVGVQAPWVIQDNSYLSGMESWQEYSDVVIVSGTVLDQGIGWTTEQWKITV
jgi:hypothetical protein